MSVFPHPGQYLVERVLPRLNVSLDEFAEHIDEKPVKLKRFAAGKVGLTAGLVAKLQASLGIDAELWMALEDAHQRWK
jgi:addiction module HigA family antidote